MVSLANRHDAESNLDVLLLLVVLLGRQSRTLRCASTLIFTSWPRSSRTSSFLFLLHCTAPRCPRPLPPRVSHPNVERAPTHQLRTRYNGGKLPGHGGVGQYVTALCAATSLADIITGGSFGKVYKAVDRRTGEIVAIKHVGASPPMQDQTAHPP
jgi:hypothetical protein